jgi:hypothetical protein
MESYRNSCQHNEQVRRGTVALALCLLCLRLLRSGLAKNGPSGKRNSSVLSRSADPLPTVFSIVMARSTSGRSNRLLQPAPEWEGGFAVRQTSPENEKSEKPTYF